MAYRSLATSAFLGSALLAPLQAIGAPPEIHGDGAGGARGSACSFESAANCQQVQTVIGLAPFMDRNPNNGFDRDNAQVTADDVKFGGNEVDNICWHTGFFEKPCCTTTCVQNIDDTWEIRIYENDAGIPGAEVGMSTISVLSKVEGTGQATGTWQYSGQLDSTIALPNGGLAGDTYWFEVSGFGQNGCETRATWSRDDGNNHAAFSIDQNPLHTYSPIQLLTIDLGFCEDSGLASPGPVLGTCCTCPAICTPNVSHDECTTGLLGVWTLGGSCSPNECPGVPANDDCSSPFVVSGASMGNEVVVAGHNICATDDGPELTTDPGIGLCGQSLVGGADMRNDVWYLYEGQPCGIVMVDSCNDADFDQMISVYIATSGCPVDEFHEIHCNDDGCASAGPSSVEFRFDEGDRFLIRVGGWDDGVSPLADPRGRFNLHFQYTLGGRRTPSIEAPLPAAPPHDILKNRYISIDPRGAYGINNGRRFYISLRLTETLVDGVEPPMEFWASEPDENCVSIVVPEQPAAARFWDLCPTLHLTGCPIIPTTTYSIKTVNCGNYSFEYLAQTQAKPGVKLWGDAVGSFDGVEWGPPNGVVSIEDAVAAIKTFQDPNAFNATHVSVTDIHPNRPDLGGNSAHPNLLVNIDDVFQFIRCFQGEAYLGGQLDLCTAP